MAGVHQVEHAFHVYTGLFLRRLGNSHGSSLRGELIGLVGLFEDVLGEVLEMVCILVEDVDDVKGVLGLILLDGVDIAEAFRLREGEISEFNEVINGGGRSLG